MGSRVPTVAMAASGDPPPPDDPLVTILDHVVRETGAFLAILVTENGQLLSASGDVSSLDLISSPGLECVASIGADECQRVSRDECVRLSSSAADQTVWLRRVFGWSLLSVAFSGTERCDDVEAAIARAAAALGERLREWFRDAPVGARPRELTPERVRVLLRG